jgi:putative Mn2+ efflux pump MntP
MDHLVIFGIALGLAMDAFAVAVAASATLRGATARQTFRFSFHFGLFQFLMPVIGWAAGQTIADWAKSWDHWLAFGILVGIGGKALVTALRHKDEPKVERADPTRGWSLVLLSLATSIDALAVGLSFAMLGVAIWYPSAIIGLVAAAITFVGMRIGSRLGAFLGWRVEVLGGAALILIGIKVLADHI